MLSQFKPRYFTFSSTSYRHIIEARGRGIWAFRFHGDPSGQPTGFDKMCRTKALNAHIGDYVLFYCSDPEHQGIVTLARIKSPPVPEVYTGALWEPDTLWHLLVELEFLTPISENRLVTKEMLIDLERSLGDDPTERIINNLLAPVPTKSYTPLMYMTGTKFLAIKNYLEGGHPVDSSKIINYEDTNSGWTRTAGRADDEDAEELAYGKKCVNESGQKCIKVQCTASFCVPQEWNIESVGDSDTEIGNYIQTTFGSILSYYPQRQMVDGGVNFEAKEDYNDWYGSCSFDDGKVKGGGNIYNPPRSLTP
jgi:hypothetical protein